MGDLHTRLSKDIAIYSLRGRQSNLALPAVVKASGSAAACQCLQVVELTGAADVEESPPDQQNSANCRGIQQQQQQQWTCQWERERETDNLDETDDGWRVVVAAAAAIRVQSMLWGLPASFYWISNNNCNMGEKTYRQPADVEGTHRVDDD